MSANDETRDRGRSTLDREVPETDGPSTDALEEKDFAQMLAESGEPRSYHVGETVEGTIVAVGQDVAFVDVGGKGEATIDLTELGDPADPGAAVEPHIGDRLRAVVVSTAGGLTLSHRLARGAASREQLHEAFRSGLPVEGRVETSIKGGYEVRMGGERAFCPISQIDAVYTPDASVHEGQDYTFRIIELKDDGKNLVVSRRVLLEEAERERADEVRATIIPGAELPGRAVSVKSYGAFIDLGGGIQGLLHVSDMGWSHVSKPTEVVQLGDKLTVKVLQVDDEHGKISLGLKQLQPDPWSRVQERYLVGQTVEGRVTRLTEFGAFVELEPGVEALAHVSTFPPTGRRDGWKEDVKPGGAVMVEVLSVQVERKRIGIAIVAEDVAEARRGTTGDTPPSPTRTSITAGARLIGKVERLEPYGVFVFLAPGRTGLMPIEETGLERDGDLRKAFPIGSDVDVIVLEMDSEGRRIRLSHREALAAEETRAVREYSKGQEQQPTESLGTLADKLRAAMQQPKA